VLPFATYQREIPWSYLSEGTRKRLEMRQGMKGMRTTTRENKVLETALNILTETERDAFVAVRGACISFSQVAQLMNCSKGSVQSYVQRAEEKLRRFFALRKPLYNRREF
jgi:RNA polymerase sigma-70 factor (ECF subfamily)